MINLVALAQRITDRVALCRKKCKTHATADQQLIYHAHQSFNHSQLVAHLGATEHRDERRLRAIAQAAEHRHLMLDQSPCCRAKAARWANNRSVGAMGSTERIIDVQVHTLHKMLDKFSIVAFFT